MSQRAPSRSFIPLRRLMTYVPKPLFCAKLCSHIFPQTLSVPRKKHFELYLLSNIYIMQCVGQNVYDQLNVYCVGCFA